MLRGRSDSDSQRRQTDQGQTEDDVTVGAHILQKPVLSVLQQRHNRSTFLATSVRQALIELDYRVSKPREIPVTQPEIAHHNSEPNQADNDVRDIAPSDVTSILLPQTHGEAEQGQTVKQ